MDGQNCNNCARRNKETSKCTLPMRSDMKPNGWCYRWLGEDPDNKKIMGIGEDIMNFIEKVVGGK